MIISHEHRFLFVEVPQTGSTAIAKELLEQYGCEEILHKHAHLREFLNQASRKERSYKVAAGTRHPLDRVLGHHTKLRNNHRGAYDDPERFEENGGWVSRADRAHFAFVKESEGDFGAYLRRYYGSRSVKVSQYAWGRSRYDQLIRFEHLNEDFHSFLRSAGVEPLRRRKLLAAVLVQFPSGFHETPSHVRRLGQLAALLDGLPTVLEVRHRSWFEPPALSVIAGLGYSLAHIDLPPAWDHPPARFRSTGPIGYLRLHGRNQEQWFRSSAGRDERYDYLYTPAEIGDLAYRADAVAEDVDDTYVITNNHFGGQALANAIELRWLLGGREPVPAPAALVEAFPHLAPLTRVEGQQGLFQPPS